MTTKAALEDLATSWLAAEAIASERVDERAQRAARDLSAAYDAAIRTASLEDLRLAVEAARRRQAAQDVGSAEWMDARRVTVLLQTEYEAARATGRR